MDSGKRERVLVEPGIKPGTFCSQVVYAMDWTMGLGWKGLKTFLEKEENTACQHFILFFTMY